MATYEEPLLKEGYLVKAPDTQKNIQNFRKWQRKLFRLDSRGDLYFYDSEKSPRPIGIIPISLCLRLFNAKGKFGDQLSYCFGIELSDVTYYIKAESARTFNEWVEPLSKFAGVCELSMLPESSSDRRGTLSSEVGEGPGYRTSSIVSRHFSVATKAKFLSKEGWLAKTGGNNRGWKDRYFVLANGKLTYYKSEKKDNPLGSVDLFECTGIDRGNGKKGFGFDIKVPGRVFNISSDSEASQNDWISTISHSLGLIKDIKSSSSGVPRSDSNSSESSRDLAILESLAPPAESQNETSSNQDTTVQQSSSSSSLQAQHMKKEDKKESDVVQLLEVEVDALRHKVTSLEDDLKSSTTANSQLQQQLSEVNNSLSSSTRQLTEERNSLQLQLEQLQKSKSELETINDSLRTQLEEHIERLQDMDEEQLGLRQELEEVQNTSTAVEEELVDTQQKLHEIEEVAKSLEEALRKRSESEPQTPVGGSAKALGLIYQAKLESSLSAGRENSETESKMESQFVEKLQDQLKQREIDLAKLEEELKQLKAIQPAIEETTMTSSQKGDNAAVLSEERLRWQMEMENLRKELTAKMDAEKEPIIHEKEALENRLKLLEETNPSLTKEQVVALENNLTEAQSRVQQLQVEIGSQAEKISQLQVEKEKAVADLIAIRKINRNIEKKISETEVSTPTSALLAESPVNSTQDTEKVIGELRSALEQIVKERDQLKLQLDNQQSGEALNTGAGLFRFRSKTLATVASTNRLTSGDIVTANTTQNANSSPIQGNPPPKPKRPPKEVLNRYSYQHQHQEQQPQQQQQTRAINILQTLFARR